MASNLPKISSPLPPDVRALLERLREFVSNAPGQFASKDELVSAGVITVDAYDRILAGSGGEIDGTPPPSPTGVAASGAMTTILLQWDDPAGYYANFSFAEIYRSGTDDLTTAVHIGTSTGTRYADAVAEGSSYYYWVRFWSNAKTPGAWNATAGTLGQTAANTSYMLSTLANSITRSQLAQSLLTPIDSVAGLETTASDATEAGKAAVRALLQVDAARDSARVEKVKVVKIDELSSVVGENTATIRTQQESIDGIHALYAVKLDVNGVVSGFALNSELAAGGAVSSKMLVAVDQFAIIAPGRTPGQLNSVPFAVLTSPQTINGVDFQAGVYMDGASINVGTVGNLQLADLAADDAKISSVSAAKIRTGELAADTQITVGGKLVLDGNGFIDSYGPGPVGQRNFTRMDAGDVVTYRYVPGLGPVPYKSLNRVETGIAQNNALVVIPGYFDAAPRVLVSPAALQTYESTYSGQSQTLDCSAGAVTETAPGSKRWQFTPVARLNLSASTSAAAPNTYWPAAGDYTVDNAAWYSDSMVTPANTTKIRPSVNAYSVRGTGTAPDYYLRFMNVYIEYWTGAAWVASLLGMIPLGATVGWSGVVQLPEFILPSAGTWTWRLAFATADAGGTFASGTGGYAYSTETLTAANTSITTNASFVSGNTTYWQNTATAALPASAVNTSWEIYQITYSWSRRASFSTDVFPFDGLANCTWRGANTYTSPSGYVSNPTTYGPQSLSATIAGTSLTYDPSYIYATAAVRKDSGYSHATAYIDSPQATIYRRTPIVNSTTPANRALLSSVLYTLSGATVLATGTLNWMAVS